MEALNAERALSGAIDLASESEANGSTPLRAPSVPGRSTGAAASTRSARETAPPGALLSWRATLAVRWIIAGDGVSNFGTQLAAVAVPTYAIAYLGSNSGDVGLIYVLQWSAPLLLGLTAGQLADRVDQTGIMLIADLVAFSALSLLAYLMFTTAVPLWGLCALTTIVAAVGTFYSMGSAALIPRLLPPMSRGHGNARLEAARSASEVSALLVSARLVGIAFGCIVMAINALSHLFRLIAILRTRSLLRGSSMQSNASDEPIMASTWSVAVSMLGRNSELRPLFGAHATASLGGAIILTYFYEYAYSALAIGPADVAVMLAIGNAAGFVGALLFPRLNRVLSSTLLLRASLCCWVAGVWIIPFTVRAYAMEMLIAYQLVFSFSSTLFAIGLITKQQNVTLPQFQGRIASISLLLGYAAMSLGGVVTMATSAAWPPHTGIVLGCVISSATGLWFVRWPTGSSQR